MPRGPGGLPSPPPDIQASRMLLGCEYLFVRRLERCGSEGRMDSIGNRKDPSTPLLAIGENQLSLVRPPAPCLGRPNCGVATGYRALSGGVDGSFGLIVIPPVEVTIDGFTLMTVCATRRWSSVSLRCICVVRGPASSFIYFQLPRFAPSPTSHLASRFAYQPDKYPLFLIPARARWP